MDNIKHTSGPWMAIKTGERVVDTVIDKKDSIICQLHNGCINHNQEHINQNAALISAAPELLAAVKELLPYAEHLAKNHDTGVIERAKAAIAKATNIDQS